MDAHPTPSQGSDDSVARLAAFIERHPRLLVLGGAGCSTESGIPDYRDDAGAWKRRPPVTWQAFTQEPLTRARYWARSLVGWPLLAAARPNAAHESLARLENAGHIDLLVTQNVDGLHEAAGSRRVIDLHGRIDRIVCTACGDVTPRAAFQLRLAMLNPDWAALSATSAPDGDADLESQDFAGFVVPECAVCSGRLKPDVVFFGENVPPARVTEAMAGVERADAMLIVGSSLMVYSGFRFARAAAQRGIPIAAVNRGVTRADSLLELKIERGVGEVLADTWQHLQR
jgi:NAD-dependent SIR2 family protein deacetylase